MRLPVPRHDRHEGSRLEQVLMGPRLRGNDASRSLGTTPPGKCRQRRRLPKFKLLHGNRMGKLQMLLQTFSGSMCLCGIHLGLPRGSEIAALRNT